MVKTDKHRVLSPHREMVSTSSSMAQLTQNDLSPGDVRMLGIDPLELVSGHLRSHSPQTQYAPVASYTQVLSNGHEKITSS